MSDCIDCKDCVEVQPIPTCTTDIIVCDDLGLTTAYQDTLVYIENLCTGHVSRFPAVIANSMVTIAPDYVFHPECKYRLWINASEETPKEQEMFTIEGFECYCVEFDIFRMFDDTYTSVTQFASTFKVKNRD